MSATPHARNAFAGYEILKELSQGGMGQVLLARRQGVHGFERLVAIKTIRSDLRGFDRLRDMFLDEARLMARLHHPNIAQVHDFGESDGHLYLVMEYVAGVDFDTLVDQSPAPEVCALAIAAVCRGLHAAHELRDEHGDPLGVVHRDISPPNLFLTFDGQVKILDFGIAFMRGRQAPVTEYGTIKGKPPYMAPEQLKNDRLDRRTDIWAVGNVLHEMLTGERLVTGASAYEVVQAIHDEDFAPPSATAGELPDGLDDAVMRALEKQPDARFQDALSMAQALERVAAEAAADSLEGYAARALAEAKEQHRDMLRAAIEARSEKEPVGRSSLIMTEPGSFPDPAPEEPQKKKRRLGPFVALTGVLAAAAITFFATRPDTSAPVADVAPPATIDAPPIEPAPSAVPAAVDQDPAPEPAPTKLEPAPEPEPEPEPKKPPPKRPPRRRPKPPPANPETTTAPVTGFAFLTIAAKPYARVRLDGNEIGPTPIIKRRVPAGTHRIEFLTPDTGAVRDSRTVTLKPDQVKSVIAR